MPEKIQLEIEVSDCQTYVDYRDSSAAPMLVRINVLTTTPELSTQRRCIRSLDVDDQVEVELILKDLKDFQEALEFLQKIPELGFSQDLDLSGFAAAFISTILAAETTAISEAETEIARVEKEHDELEADDPEFENGYGMDSELAYQEFEVNADAVSPEIKIQTAAVLAPLIEYFSGTSAHNDMHHCVLRVLLHQAGAADDADAILRNPPAGFEKLVGLIQASAYEMVIPLFKSTIDKFKLSLRHLESKSTKRI